MPNFQTPLLTAAGRTLVAGRLLGIGSPPSYINWGTGSSAPSLADTALGAELGARVAVTTAVVFGPISGLAQSGIQYTATLVATSSANVREIGLFDAASGGTLVARCLLAQPFPVLPGDTLALAFTLEFL